MLLKLNLFIENNGLQTRPLVELAPGKQNQLLNYVQGLETAVLQVPDSLKEYEKQKKLIFDFVSEIPLNQKPLFLYTLTNFEQKLSSQHSSKFLLLLKDDMKLLKEKMFLKILL